jgi:preprotein translocase SecE subunit
MNLSFYKKGQGMITRITALLFVSAFELFGCISLYRFVPTEDNSVNPPMPKLWGKSLLEIGFFDTAITVGLVISLVLFVLLVLLSYIFIVNRPRTADYLIETEYELRKVSWPPRYEYWGASLAVTISVVVMSVFLLSIDYVWGRVMHLIGLH